MSASRLTAGRKLRISGGRTGGRSAVASTSGVCTGGRLRRGGASVAGSSRASARLREARQISSATATTTFIALTSCTRTKCVPAKTAAATAAAVANSVSRSSGWAKKDFRDAPTRIGSSRRIISPKRARISEFCSRRLPNPMPGSITMRDRSTPARRARLTLASKSLMMFPITSGMGPRVAQVSGRPRM